MKNPKIKPAFIILVIGILLISLPQCKKLLDAFNIDATFSTNFQINVSESNELVFFDEKIIDLSSNQEFADNKDKIDKYTVKEVYYKIVGYDGDSGILGSGVLSFLDDNNIIGEAVVQENVDFESLFNSAIKTDLPVSESTLNKLAEVLKNKAKFKAKIEGTVTNKPVFVEVEISVVIGASVQP